MHFLSHTIEMKLFCCKSNESSSAALLWLLAMPFYVPVVALAIRPALVPFRTFLILAAWTALWLLPYVFFRKRVFCRIAMIPLFAGGLLNLAHWLVLRCPINVSSLFILLNTNGSEAMEFVTLKMSLRWLLLLPYLFFAWMAFRRIQDFPQGGRRIAKAALTLFVLLFYGEALLNGRFVRTALPDTERTLCSFSQEVKAYRSLKQRHFRPVEARADTRQTVSVLILGESCNRNHMSLYGYGRRTSPKLSRRGDIICFSDVITPYSSTLDAVLAALSESGIDNPVSPDSCIHALDVYRSAGFRTFWISNQSPLGMWDNAIYNFAQVADRCLFVNRAANSSFESTQLAVYDEALLEPLRKVLEEDTAPRKWIVLHLMGSHSQYDRRYPSKYAHFSGGNDRKQRVRDAYDNSVLYNDAIVDSVFSMLALYAGDHPDARVHALYISDHGENVYDAGETAGHDYADTIPDANIEIPFVLWLSSHDRLDTAFCSRLEARRRWPFMTDDLFHLLLDLDGISTPSLQPQRSLFNVSYRRERPRRLSDGREYFSK